MEVAATTMWRVMISSTMQDLPTERETARSVLQEEGLTSLNAEDPHSDFIGSPYELSIDYAKACNLYVLIIGKRYGSRPEGMPEGDTRSVTHLEFETARAVNPRKIRILMPSDAWQIAEDDRQREFLRELSHFRNGYDFFTYDRLQPGSLATKIHQIVREWLASGIAGRDAYMSQVSTEYATFTNPVTGKDMHYEAMVSLRLRTQPSGRTGSWEAQMEAEDRRRMEHVKGSGRRGSGKDNEDDRQREQLRQVTQPIIAQVEEFLTRFGKLVVLGDPGTGKSTLLKRLAHETAHEYLQRPEAAVIPVVVSAASLGDFFRERAPTSTADLARGIGTLKAAETNNEERRPTIATTVEVAIDNGRALLLVDGLDETTERERISAIAALGHIGSNQAILASRPAAYADGSLSGWEVCETQRLDDAERRRVIEQVFATLPGGARSPDPDTLLQQLSERADLLMWSGNPLLLTLISTQYARDQRLPDNRARIYEFAVEDMQRQRPLTASRLLTQREFEDRLRQLALRMFEARETLVTEERMLAILQTADPSTTEEIVIELRERSGVFLEQTRGWRFVHLTFQEYLAACALADQSMRQRDAFCLRRSLSARWEQVFLLLVSRLDLLNRHAEGNRVIARLIKADRQRVPALGAKDPTHLALRRATRLQIDRPMHMDARLPILWLKRAWWPIWRKTMHDTSYEGQVAYLVYQEFDSGFDDNSIAYDIPAMAPELQLALETDPIAQTPRFTPAQVIIPSLIIWGLFALFALVGYLMLSIPPFTHSGFGQWWSLYMPMVLLALALLFIVTRLAVFRTFIGTLKLQMLFEDIASFAIPWSRGDRKFFAVLWRALIKSKSLSFPSGDTKNILPDLVPLLKDTDSDVRQAAAHAIGALGPSALPDLVPLLKDTDSDVRQAAAQAISIHSNNVSLLETRMLVRLVSRPLGVRSLGLSTFVMLFDAGVLGIWMAEQAAYLWYHQSHIIFTNLDWLAWLQKIFTLTTWWQVLWIIAGYVIINSTAIFLQYDIRAGRHDSEQALFDSVSAILGRVDDKQTRELINENEEGVVV